MTSLLRVLFHAALFHAAFLHDPAEQTHDALLHVGRWPQLWVEPDERQRERMAIEDGLMLAVSLPDLPLDAVALVCPVEIALRHRDEHRADRHLVCCRFRTVCCCQRHIDQPERKRSHASALAATEEAVDELLVVQPFCLGQGLA